MVKRARIPENVLLAKHTNLIMGKKTNDTMAHSHHDGCHHVQLGGMAYYGDRFTFMFAPCDPVPDVARRMRPTRGVAQQMTDGTFDFVAQPKLRAQSTLIRKLAHGRVSKTKDGAIQLTLKVMPDENINIGEAISAESAEAVDAIVDFQLKR